MRLVNVPHMLDLTVDLAKERIYVVKIVTSIDITDALSDHEKEIILQRAKGQEEREEYERSRYGED